MNFPYTISNFLIIFSPSSMMKQVILYYTGRVALGKNSVKHFIPSSSGVDAVSLRNINEGKIC